MKRSDITTEMVLEAFAARDVAPPDVSLMEKTGAPLKVIHSAIERESEAGHIEYGVSLRGGWLTEKGGKKLWSLKGDE